MKDDLQEISNEKLIKDLKFKKIILGFYIGIILMMMISAVILTMKKGVNAFTFLPFTFIFILFLAVKNYNKTRKELRSRNIN